MNQNPYEPPGEKPEDDSSVGSESDDQAIATPVLAYTASGNLEAHSVVTWLESNDVQAYAVEDNSSVGSSLFGTVSQFHKPQVFVDTSDADRAGALILQFEQQRDLRHKDLADAPPIKAECEDCGATSEFPANQDGTTQTCPKCHAFIDVGEIDWPEDFDFEEAESVSTTPDNIEDAIDAASRLDSRGDWDEAIVAYKDAASRWPDHATYIGNCIREIEGKRNAANESRE
ncbi:hypothetical protein Poly51_30620 [Rubripirellula tenax]|uniref:Uncharacterized protein n=1 Tax=Rubripirellula tenax TaxID=2528015 RepID=A0A5C6EZV9_9BACT|nr:DUF2007 domain-containing protein [Rubripirellula tenax]TWU54345.1 hypothetical protein Poly51_30620 [Rubripirellula tenax]